MKKLVKWILGTAAVLVILLLLAAGWYLYEFYPRQAESFILGTPEANRHALIATQGSEFKNTVLGHLVQSLASADIYLQVIDVSSLPEFNYNDWSSIVILNTCIANKPSKYVTQFLEEADSLSKIMIVTTSGGGDFDFQDPRIDGITSASRMDKSREIADTLYQRLMGF